MPLTRSVTSKALFALVLAFGVAAAVPGAAPAQQQQQQQQQQKMHQNYHERMRQEFYRAINATPEQIRQLEALDERYEARMRPLYNTLWQRKIALMEYVATPQATPQQALQFHEQILQIESQIGQLRIQEGFDKKRILSPEQMQRGVQFYREHIEKWSGKSGEMRD